MAQTDSRGDRIENHFGRDASAALRPAAPELEAIESEDRPESTRWWQRDGLVHSASDAMMPGCAAMVFASCQHIEDAGPGKWVKAGLPPIFNAAPRQTRSPGKQRWACGEEGQAVQQQYHRRAPGDKPPGFGVVEQEVGTGE